MKISEVVVDEAISVSLYQRDLLPVMQKAICDAFMGLRDLKDENHPAVAAYGDDNASHKDFYELVRTRLTKNIATLLTPRMLNAINKTAGVPVVTKLWFTFMEGNTRGWAQDRDIALNIKYLKSLGKKAADQLIEMTSNSYNGEERIDGFYFNCRSIGSGDQYLSSFIVDAVKDTLTKLASTTVHELVHVLQHNKQEIKGRPDTEYRSYLDKYKGEFDDIRTKHDAAEKQGAIDSDLNNRYFQLYTASPQEIPAFAHQAALEVIHAYGFDDTDNPQDLQLNYLESSDIINAVNKVTSNRFSKPKNPREAMVYKRYVKLVYLEVVRYVQGRLAQLQKK